ncbi:hypothetical protein [Pseudomonas rossensis]|uniref:hypothetical protein n=1 Tax=Pseudomonas rossensis TaxID=2305471 RepID=UPI003260DEF8
MRALLNWSVVLILITASIAGCSSHKKELPTKTVEEPIVLIANEQNSKVIFKAVSIESPVSFKIGAPGNLIAVGVVYNDAQEQQMPAFARGLYKGLIRGIYGARPSREILVPASQLTEVEGQANWRNDRGTSYRVEKCGPLSHTFLAQPNKTYLVEFDLQNFTVCNQKIFDITNEGQKDQISSATL